MKTVNIPIELLEALIDPLSEHSESHKKVREILAQPAVDGGLEVVAYQWLDTAHFRRKVPAASVRPHWYPLVRKSDADARDAMRLEQVKGLVEALETISAIEDRYNCGDWDEIAEARRIADEAIATYRAAQEGK